MNWIILALLSFLVFNHGLQGVELLPIPFEKQLEDSDGIIIGKFLGSDYKRSKDGQVVTEASFIILKVAGVNRSEIINVNNFKVNYPGGVWLGDNYPQKGAPTFTKGEEVILLLKKNFLGHSINNLNLGKYNIIRDEGERYISSSEFPDHRNLGKIPWDEFEEMVMEVYHERPQRPRKDKYVYARAKTLASSRNRRPASLASSSQAEYEENRFSILWPAILIGGIILLFFWFIRDPK